MVDHSARCPCWSSPAATVDTSHVEGSFHTATSHSSFNRLHRLVSLAAVITNSRLVLICNVFPNNN